MRFTFPIILAFVATSTIPSLAQEVKGAPKALIGKFGNSPAQCQSYNRKVDDVASISDEYLTSCGGSSTFCEAKIVSHRFTENGFILKFVSEGNPNGWAETVTRVDSDVFEFRSQISKQKNVTTLVRCTVKDAVAGIGKKDFQSRVNDTKGVQASDLAFSTYYATAIPKACPGILVDNEAVQKALAKAKGLWTHHDEDLKRKFGRGWMDTFISFLKAEERAAVVAVKADLEEIPKFCTEVIDAFGPKGRVLPGMISDTRKKA